MSPLRSGGLVAVGLVAGGAVGRFVAGGAADPIAQPIAFNHVLHAEGGIACETCHPGAKEGIRAGLPAMSVCLECHEEEISENPEEGKVREYLERPDDIPWTPLAWVGESNVLFSHRRHAGVAGIACDGCHGAVEKTTTPPDRPLFEWSMDRCLDCHHREGISEDCLACHR